MNTTIACPECGLLDQVQKVSGMQLPTPPQPTYQSTWGCVSVFLMFICVSWVVAGIGMIVVGIANANGALGMGLFIVGWWGFLAFALVSVKRPVANRRRAELAMKMQAWNLQRELRSRQYYCRRCDYTFIPQS